MNLVTFSFVLVTLIDALPLDKTPESLVALNSSTDWWDQQDYVIGSMITDEQLAAHVGLVLYTKADVSIPTASDMVIATPLNATMPLTDDTKAILQSTFNPNVKTIWESHGFKDNSDTCSQRFVRKYLNVLPEDYQVVCVDWSYWAAVDVVIAFFGNVYRREARQCVDVGDYLGRYLAQFVAESGIDPSNLHLIGHSLGAHIVGTMGRTFTRETQTILPRVTGLDPAGPLFVRNAFGLNTHMIKASDATFVDIIHTNGGLDPYAAQYGHASRLGALQQLGHADFYPNGGEMQPQCRWSPLIGLAGRSTCSHSGAVQYYIESIDTNEDAFNTILCGVGLPRIDAILACNQHSRGTLHGNPSEYNGNNHMGFYAVKPTDLAVRLYFLDIDGSGRLANIDANRNVIDPPAKPFSVCC